MNLSNRIVSIMLGLVILSSIFSLWYKETYSMDVAKAFEVHADNKSASVLIATQESVFKDQLSLKLIERLDDKETYIKVIDVSGLSELYLESFDAVFIVHTWEMWAPPKPVDTFLNSVSRTSNIYTIGTSGSGDLKHENLDGISSASEINNIEYLVTKAMAWYNNLNKDALANKSISTDY